MRTIGAFGQWDNVGVFIASNVLLLVGPYELPSLTIYLGSILTLIIIGRSTKVPITSF